MYFSAITLSIMKGREGLCRLIASLGQRYWLSVGEHQKVYVQMYSIFCPT
jgi:hypothetical protein